MIIEGLECEDKSVAVTGIKPGEMYFAKRNTGWHLLEFSHLDQCCVCPVGVGYPYFTWECFKVKE